MSDSRIINLPTASEVPDTAYLMIDSAVDVEDENTGSRKILVSKMGIVNQVNTTEYSSLRVLLSNSANDTEQTDVVKKSSKLTFSPLSGILTVGADPTRDLDVATKHYVDHAKDVILGTDPPSDDLGMNKDLYIKYSLVGEEISRTTIFNGEKQIERFPPSATVTLSDDIYNYDVLIIPIRCEMTGTSEVVTYNVSFNVADLKVSDDLLDGIDSDIDMDAKNVGVSLYAVNSLYVYYKPVRGETEVGSTLHFSSVVGVKYGHLIEKMYSKIAGSWEEISIGGGGGTGNVADVYENGISVLDNNHIAQIKTHKEVTQAEYDALPSSKLTDGIMYCITDSSGFVDIVETLTSGNTSLTITNNAITTDSTIDYYTSIFGVNPTDAVVTTGQIVLTFEAQQTDMQVKVRLS